MAMNDPSSLGTGGPSTSDLDGLLDALQNGITSISPQTALPILQSWQMQLQALPSPSAQTVAGDLNQLYDILSSDGNMGLETNIGSLLSTLGADIRALAEESGDASGLGAKLEKLASLLEKPGTTLNDNGA